jgi:sucrose-6-phosphate hydrolase SacC (GH32 family)
MRFIALSLAATLLSAAAAPEPWRPLYHFTPAKNWMNDPNGMVYHDGEWHLFYQYNPFGDKWGHMSWGHAVSRDLLTWEHLPVALPEENGIMIFSGSAVMDEKNTSGFGKDGKAPMVAIYTAHTDKNQSQALAYSNDRGRTWTKFSGNPVLDIGDKDFRDPKVIWHEPTKRWVMTVAWPGPRKVRFYSSPDLKQWTHLSDFGPAGSVAGIWECPDMFPLKVEGGGEKWVLIVNVGSGAPATGSGGQYFVGEFDGRTFKQDTAPPPSAPAGETVLGDFEGQDYGDWKATGDCFGKAPAKGVHGNQQPVTGFAGKGLVNTFLHGDNTQGTLTSPEFTISKDWVNFLIGGGAKPGKACVNLRVDGRIVRTATGRAEESLQAAAWSVKDLRGKKGIIEIVDNAVGDWGHLNADHFVLSDTPARGGGVASWLDYGPDFYAGITWSGAPDGRRILLAWMSNWQYANDVPTSPWRSTMSVPRELSLRSAPAGLQLVQQPVKEFDTFAAGGKITFSGPRSTADTELAKPAASGNALDITTTLAPDASGTCELEVLSDGHSATKIGVSTTSGVLYVDRTHCGREFNARFAARIEAPLRTVAGEPVKLRVLVDACSVEVFAEDGTTSLTALTLPPPGAKSVRINTAAEVKDFSMRVLAPR